VVNIWWLSALRNNIEVALWHFAMNIVGRRIGRKNFGGLVEFYQRISI
jgi:hypothetical protein